jgi:choline dehydrogenase-like flavoprotein
MPSDQLKCQVAVIGSGPGGAVTACALSEAGKDVLVLEEGPFLDRDATLPFSLEEMRQKYRNGGISFTFGSGKIAWAEGRCVGGGSEINSALYHRTPEDVLRRWRTEFGVVDMTCAAMERHFQAGEQELSVNFLPGPPPPASVKLADGARALGWRSVEVPRAFAYDGEVDSAGVARGTRQSMTKTFLRRAVQAGCRISPDSRVLKIRPENGGVSLDVQTPAGLVTARCHDLFVCGGAVQTPALLRRSGFRHNIGNSLAMHPTVKVVAQFDEIVNYENAGVPSYQVTEFAPHISIGSSISSRPHLALAVSPHPELRTQVLRESCYSSIYYAMIAGETNGRVRTLPWALDPLVKYDLSRQTLHQLGRALRLLCRLLFEAGARELHPCLSGFPVLRSPDDLSKLPSELLARDSSLMTVHLFSSCPMGEGDQCATDSFGQVRGTGHVYINDASLLPTATGCNPQGSIMAVARRNALHYLKRL